MATSCGGRDSQLPLDTKFRFCGLEGFVYRYPFFMPWRLFDSGLLLGLSGIGLAWVDMCICLASLGLLYFCCLKLCWVGCANFVGEKE